MRDRSSSQDRKERHALWGSSLSAKSGAFGKQIIASQPRHGHSADRDLQSMGSVFSNGRCDNMNSAKTSDTTVACGQADLATKNGCT
jgi:hypothetical protein